MKEFEGNCRMTISDMEINQSSDSPSAEHYLEPPFFQVSLRKLAVMSVFTLGLYEFYWFYRNWKLIRAHENTNIWPFWRTVFGILWCHACFRRIVQFGKYEGITTSVRAGPLAAAWIITNFTAYLPDPFYLISFLGFLFILPIQALANRINNLTAHNNHLNSQFSVWNWLAIVIGGGVLALAIWAAFNPYTLTEI
jgi:hypothetical protein